MNNSFDMCKRVRDAFLLAGVLFLISGMPLPLEAKNPVVSHKGDLEKPHKIEQFLLHYNKVRSDKTVKKVYDTKGFKKLVRDLDLKLFGGPVVGSVTSSSAKVWVRTTKPIEVRIVAGKSEESVGDITSDPIQTKVENDMTGVMKIEGLDPYQSYHYNVQVGGEPVFQKDLPSFKTYPEKGRDVKFSVGFGGGARVRSKAEHIWNTIASRNPIAFLMLGDNVYIDQPKSTYMQREYYYRRQVRPEYQNLSSTTAMYAIWDDHDFADNDSAGGPDPFKPKWKPTVWTIFKENWVNPYYGGGKEQPGCWFHFSIGDVDFFMLDGRYYRNKGESMLGPVQKKWLFKKLATSDATFKVIASGTPWGFAAGSGSDAWAGFAGERKEIFTFLHKEEIGGVILLSADRHRSDIYKINRENGYPLYEFLSSKLTNGHTHDINTGSHYHDNEEVLYSYNEGNFFGLLTFDLTADDPTVTFQNITSENKKQHEMTIKRSQLQAK
jgi:alkaline phosphatase D